MISRGVAWQYLSDSYYSLSEDAQGEVIEASEQNGSYIEQWE